MTLFLFALLSLLSRVEAKVIPIENEKIEFFSEQNFSEVSAENDWLGLLYLQDKFINQDQISCPCFSLGSFSQNFLGEVCLKSIIENFTSSFQNGKTLTSHQENDGRDEGYFEEGVDLVDSWKKLDVLNDNAFRNLKKDPDFLKKFDDVVKNDGLNKHVLEGDISYEILETGQKKWKVGGVHHKTAFDNSTARIKPGTKSTPNANGYYTAKIEVYHPEFPDNGGFKVKSKESTFFPDDWSVDKLQAEIAGAIKNKGTPTVYPDGRKLYKGTMTDGAELAIWENAAGNITSTYPVL